MAERLRKRPVDKPHLETGAAHHLGRGGVLGDFLGEGFDAAGAFEVGAPPQHGLALGETEAERIGNVLPARLIGVEERAFEFGPESLRPASRSAAKQRDRYPSRQLANRRSM